MKTFERSQEVIPIDSELKDRIKSSLVGQSSTEASAAALFPLTLGAVAGLANLLYLGVSQTCNLPLPPRMSYEC